MAADDLIFLKTHSVGGRMSKTSKLNHSVKIPSSKVQNIHPSVFFRFSLKQATKHALGAFLYMPNQIEKLTLSRIGLRMDDA